MPSTNLVSPQYDLIKQKIYTTKITYPSLRNKSEAYVFSALCIKCNVYKNPAYELYDNDFDEMIVDSQYDGGVDILLSDPSSDGSDLIIAQSKYYTSISSEDVMNAMTKMAFFYKEMTSGHYEQVNEKVQRRFISLHSELGDESRIHFVFYTSAIQSGINKKRIEKKFRELFTDSSQFDVTLYFGKDLEDEIKESESRRPSVEAGKIRIDEANNYLLYGENAAIVNASAFSIKQLYAQHHLNLLSRNLRYHIAGRDIDNGIDDTIKNCPETFWLKNNGITVICDDFEIDGKEVKLKNFSIINGGQTTYMLHKSRYIDDANDFFLPCKIVKSEGNTEDEKNAFSLAIAKATNTQKPIKAVDLKANSPEQIRFSNAMREAGIFYQTKRGETVPRQFKEPYLNSSLVEIGKLCLAGIFQIPCASRSKPSSLYLPRYYEKTFNSDQQQIAKLCRELLYIDFYFRNTYQKKFDAKNKDMPNAKERISFAHNARTICIAFVAFASRFYQGNIDNQKLQKVFDALKSDASFNSDVLYDIFSDIDGIKYFIPPAIFDTKDEYEAILDKLFETILNAGITTYSILQLGSTITATNFLKKDKNYYSILSSNWGTLSLEIATIFSGVM